MQIHFTTDPHGEFASGTSLDVNDFIAVYRTEIYDGQELIAQQNVNGSWVIAIDSKLYMYPFFTVTA